MIDTHNYSPSRLLARLNSDGDFASERDRANRRGQLMGRAALCGFLAWGSLSLVLGTNVGERSLAEAIGWVPVFLAAAAAIGMLVTFICGVACAHYSELATACEPLAGTPGCLTAVRLANDFQSAQAIRSSALAQHRQLYFADLHAMADAAKWRTPDVSAEIIKDACRSLHSGAYASRES